MRVRYSIGRANSANIKDRQRRKIHGQVGNPVGGVGGVDGPEEYGEVVAIERRRGSGIGVYVEASVVLVVGGGRCWVCLRWVMVGGLW